MSSNYYVYCYAPNTQPDSDSFILAKVTFVQVEVEDDEVVTSSTLTSATKVWQGSGEMSVSWSADDGMTDVWNGLW